AATEHLDAADGDGGHERVFRAARLRRRLEIFDIAFHGLAAGIADCPDTARARRYGRDHVARAIELGELPHFVPLADDAHRLSAFGSRRRGLSSRRRAEPGQPTVDIRA